MPIQLASSPVLIISSCLLKYSVKKGALENFANV